MTAYRIRKWKCCYPANYSTTVCYSTEVLDTGIIRTRGKNDFVGEFDLEYKLTPSGEIRLKAYNHANDMYKYLNRALTTQG